MFVKASNKLLLTGQMGPGASMNRLMRLVRKTGRRMSLPPRLCLSIANVLDVAASAAQHEMNRKIALRVAGAVAHITLRLQALRLKSLMRYLESKPPDWACAQLMWGETSERLVEDLLGNNNNDLRVAGQGKVSVAPPIKHVARPCSQGQCVLGVGR